ncbi:hypothetical protein ACQ4LD_21365, partial [Sphingobacterium daejeonense]
MKFMYLLVALFRATFAFGQHAKTILDQVSKKYDGYSTIQSDFTFKEDQRIGETYIDLPLIHISDPTKRSQISRMP